MKIGGIVSWQVFTNCKSMIKACFAVSRCNYLQTKMDCSLFPSKNRVAWKIRRGQLKVNSATRIFILDKISVGKSRNISVKCSCSLKIHSIRHIRIYIYSREIMNSTAKRSVKEQRGKEQR